MKYSGLLAPDWTGYTNLEATDLARIPGAQQLLLLAGRRELQARGLPGLDWSCCGIYRVRVNGGGLEAELAAEPDTGYYREPVQGFDPWSALEELGEWLGVELAERIVNPFSWNPLTPAILRGLDMGPPGCIYDADWDVSLAFKLPPPMRASRIVKCSRSRRGETTSIDVNGFHIDVRAHRMAGGVYGLEHGDCHGYFHQGALYLEGECALELKTPYYDHKVTILYPGSLYTTRIMGSPHTIGPVPAVSVGLWRSISLASRHGLTITIGKGRVGVDVRGSLRIAASGPKATYRLLLEDLLDWRPIKAPEDGYGNTRSSGSAFTFTGWVGDSMVFSAYNPSPEPGVVDVRLPMNGSECLIDGPLGSDRIPVDGDFLRVPVPAGFIGLAYIRLRKSRLLDRIRMGRLRSR